MNSPERQSGCDALRNILERRPPARIAYAPNYWQWFAHHREHGTLPDDVRGCATLTDLLEWLDVDVFSRNLYCDNRRAWWCGLTEDVFDGLDPGYSETIDGRDLVIERVFRTAHGPLTERLRYVHSGSTLVQEKFLVDDPDSQSRRLEALAEGRAFRFVPSRYHAHADAIGGRGLVVAGEVTSPLKFLHVVMGAEQAVYFLEDNPEAARAIMDRHEAAQLELVGEIAAAGVPVIMSMDNLDSAFQPPAFVETWSARFYEKASALCHARGASFFIHACGQQRDNLRLISSLGVDGLEGVAFPPLGDIELDEAMRLTSDRFLFTGGITPLEFERLRTRDEIFAHTKALFERMRPFRHRFIFSSSCNTPYSAPWSALLDFRDAWREFANP